MGMHSKPFKLVFWNNAKNKVGTRNLRAPYLELYRTVFVILSRFWYRSRRHLISRRFQISHSAFFTLESKNPSARSGIADLSYANMRSRSVPKSWNNIEIDESKRTPKSWIRFADFCHCRIDSAKHRLIDFSTSILKYVTVQNFCPHVKGPSPKSNQKGRRRSSPRVSNAFLRV